jgi:hypothetical protein
MPALVKEHHAGEAGQPIRRVAVLGKLGMMPTQAITLF